MRYISISALAIIVTSAAAVTSAFAQTDITSIHAFLVIDDDKRAQEIAAEGEIAIARYALKDFAAVQGYIDMCSGITEGPDFLALADAYATWLHPGLVGVLTGQRAAESEKIFSELDLKYSLTGISADCDNFSLNEQQPAADPFLQIFLDIVPSP